MKRFFVWLTVLLLPIMLSACSGGGGGSDGGSRTNTGTAMQVASKVSVVDPKLTGSVAGKPSALKMAFFKFLSAATPPGGSDYANDKINVYVEERSAEAFDTINNILCMMGQTKYDVMLNKGAYIALVDNNLCSSNKSDASSAAQDSQNQSSSSNMPDYSTFVVDSYRVDDNSPQYGEVWVHEKARAGQDPEKLIFVKFTISEGMTTTNPYGIFQLDFLCRPAVNGVPDMTKVMSKGMLKSEQDAVSGDILLKFAEENYGNWPGTRKITLNRMAAQGSAYDSHMEMVSNVSTTVVSQFDIAFDTNYFLRTDGTNTVCLNRTQFEESAWRYGLYDTLGMRVNRNSGFSVNTKADGSGAYGFIGYWGLWLDNNAAIINNKLYKFDYSSNTATPYDVVKSGGKLKKHTKKGMTLGEIKGIPLGYYEQVMGSPTGTNYQVVWDDVNLNFKKTSYMPQNCGNNCMWQDIATVPTPTIDISHLQWNQLNFWSQSLSGQVMVTLGTPSTPCSYVTSTLPMTPGYTDCSTQPPSNATPAIVYVEDLVYPGDASVPSPLACFDNCPKASTSGIDPNDPFVSTMMSGPTQTASIYTFTASGVLKDMANHPEVWSTGTNSQYQWGIMSGAMFDSAYTTPSTTNPLACDWDNTQICGWKAWSVLPEYYTWETGPNNWNQFAALRDVVTLVTLTFEPPLQVKYVHHDAAGTGPSGYEGATFMMDYTGFGNLQGIPGKCVDLDTGADTPCAPSPSIRWVPAFVIPPLQADGVTYTTVSVDTVVYFVKPLELGQRMKKDDLGCTGLTAASYPLPDLSVLWHNPAIGAEPVVTDAPAVIGGVVQ